MKEDILNSEISLVKKTISESIKVKQLIIEDEKICNNLVKVGDCVAKALLSGGKIIVCGNGGSASDALHFCGEIVGRFQRERKAAAAISLNADVATMTAVGNDYGFDSIYERGVQALMKPEDIFVGLSTSGNSENVLKAAKAAKEIGGVTVALLGKGGGKIKDIVDIPIVIPSDNTARIQECHICAIHIICEMVEKIL